MENPPRSGKSAETPCLKIACTLGGAFFCHQETFSSKPFHRGVSPQLFSISEILCFKPSKSELSVAGKAFTSGEKTFSVQDAFLVVPFEAADCGRPPLHAGVRLLALWHKFCLEALWLSGRDWLGWHCGPAWPFLRLYIS